VTDIKYNRRARYRGMKLSNCYGIPLFVRFAKDQEYLEDFKVKHPKTYKKQTMGSGEFRLSENARFANFQSIVVV
jgi:hypothetical protein